MLSVRMGGRRNQPFGFSKCLQLTRTINKNRSNVRREWREEIRSLVTYKRSRETLFLGNWQQVNLYMLKGKKEQRKPAHCYRFDRRLRASKASVCEVSSFKTQVWRRTALRTSSTLASDPVTGRSVEKAHKCKSKSFTIVEGSVLTHHKLSFYYLRKRWRATHTSVPDGTWVGNTSAKRRDIWRWQSGTCEALANAMETSNTWQGESELSPGIKCPPCPEESWVGGAVMLSTSFKLAFSSVSRTRSKIWRKKAESWHLGLEDKDLHALELLWGNAGERKSSSAHVSVSSSARPCGEDLQVLCGSDKHFEAHWRHFYAECGEHLPLAASPSQHGIG